jgi:hypothetical protein
MFKSLRTILEMIRFSHTLFASKHCCRQFVRLLPQPPILGEGVKRRQILAAASPRNLTHPPLLSPDSLQSDTRTAWPRRRPVASPTEGFNRRRPVGERTYSHLEPKRDRYPFRSIR